MKSMPFLLRDLYRQRNNSADVRTKMGKHPAMTQILAGQTMERHDFHRSRMFSETNGKDNEIMFLLSHPPAVQYLINLAMIVAHERHLDNRRIDVEESWSMEGGAMAR